MSNPYYTVTGAPTTQSRGYSATIRSEYGLIATGFDAVYTAMLLRGLKAGETWTGTHVFTGATVTFATQSALDNSTKAATTAYADSAVSASAVTLNAAIALKADIASPTFTGTPAAPTAAAGTATTQIATTAFVAGTAFSSALPAQTGNSGKFVTTDGTNASWSAVLPSQTSNSGKFLTTNGTAASWGEVLPSQTSNSGKFLTTNGTTASWAYSNVASVTTATTATTLTSTPTLLKITPASYGVAVTLPDATTCSVGGPLHIIDNKGAYPVRVLNSAGTLLGFIFAGVVSHVSLADNSTSAGVWTIENNELVGSSAQLLTTNMRTVEACVSLDNDRDFLLGKGGSNYSYGVVYNKTTNQFGSVTAIRSAAVAGSHAAIKSATDQILVVSCTSGSTAFEAVTLTINGTGISPNSAATTTLSANISTFADGCGLIAVGSSFVTSYTVDTPAAQIRALSISGTTVTIGSATVLDGTAGGLIVASSDKVIAASTATTHLYTKPYTVSGSSLSAGTGTDTNAGTKTLKKFFPTGSGRFFLAHRDATNGPYGGFVTLSGTTTSVSFALLVASGAVTIEDAILISTLKILVGSNGFCIVTDNGSGTASASTNVDSFASGDSFLYVNGTTVYAQTGTSDYTIKTIDCSSTNPSVTVNQIVSSSVQLARNFASSNAIGVRSNVGIYGTKFAQYIASSIYNPTTDSRIVRVSNGLATFVYNAPTFFGTSNAYRGKSDSERWVTDAATVITKIECVS